MTSLIYPSFKGANLGGAPSSIAPIDLDTDPIYCLLVTNGYVSTALATLQTHKFRGDLSNEVSGTGYTAGGVALSGLTLTLSNPDYIFDANDASWAAATITARGAVLFKRVGADLTTPNDDPLIALFDFGADKTSTAGTFTVQWDATGIFILQ